MYGQLNHIFQEKDGQGGWLDADPMSNNQQVMWPSDGL